MLLIFCDKIKAANDQTADKMESINKSLTNFFRQVDRFAFI